MTAQLSGNIIRTTPPSTALDTLKALVLRNIDHLEYVIDQLAGGTNEADEELLDFLDGIKQAQYRALAEHVPVAVDEQLEELRHIHPYGYQYDDGTPVREQFSSGYGTSVYFPRYDGDRATRLQQHMDWVQQVERDVKTHTTFGEIIDGINWGRNDPSLDA